MGFAVLRHSEIDCFQRRIIVSSQVQEVLWFDITDEHIAGMTLRHCPQNVTHRLGSICTGEATPDVACSMLQGQNTPS